MSDETRGWLKGVAFTIGVLLMGYGGYKLLVALGAV